jgi:ABC-type Fe3+/spermidine/putrescine transport system ATPase subunit
MLSVANLTVRFGTTTALDAVDLTAPAGATTAVMGPSGCGKSTLLRVIAGLQAAEGGSVRWHNVAVDDVPAHQRGFGLMFQDYALFPHRTVAENVAFGLRMQRRSPDDTSERVRDMLDLVGLHGFADRAIAELSGGEQQRVALARTLAPSPALVMLDEPIGALDRSLRDRLMGDMRRIFAELGVTVIYVTHDQDEAFAMADHLAVMQAGSVAQAGAPETMWRRPASRFVAEFIGLENVLSSAMGPLPSFLGVPPDAAGAAVPPDAVSIQSNPAGDARVVGVAFQSGRYRTEVMVDGHRMVGWTTQRLDPSTMISLTVEPGAVIRFDD